MRQVERLHPIADLSDIRTRTESVRAGVRLGLAVFAAGELYTAATASRPDRPLLAAIFGLFALCALLVARMPAERIVRSPRRDVFFFAWSFISVGLTAAAVGVDGGVSSPLSLLFFIPMVFAALSYPMGAVVAVGALCELGFVAVAVVSGADDPVPLAFFTGCIAMVAVMCAWQGHQHERRRQELAMISRADPLTGVLNRRGFEERVRSEIDAGLRTGRPLSVVLFDVDAFKQINDARGHPAGDEALRWLADSLGEAARPMDSVGRLGGDEFALLLPGAGQQEADQVAERVRDRVRERLSVTAGVAAFPTHGMDTDDLLGHADAELYAAKRGEMRQIAPGRRELSWAAALARAVDLRMAAADDHSKQVAGYAEGIGRQLGWSGTQLSLLRIAGMLHDVGKVSVPDSILRKAGPLSEAEMREMRRHPLTGADLVGRVDGLEAIVPWISHSHEHLDGTGYPEGLHDDQIPRASRILLVADAFDAMTNERPYRPRLTTEEALEELRRCAGTQFDPDCIEALAAHLDTLQSSNGAEPARSAATA